MGELLTNSLLGVSVAVTPQTLTLLSQVRTLYPLPDIFKGEPVMASVKKGTLTRSPQWWKHLREFKRFFWKSERQAYKKEITGGIT